MFWKTFPGENNTDMQPLNALKPIALQDNQ